ncbi:MAG: radical SAM protein [Bacteroidales bacterium]|nr:radical SAM protein [Bacteroidales bacterium]MCF8389537.1 radical SAM protein [Bacteroidales bacterium]
MYKYLFGPVPSRRLGMSLGVDLVPHKVCSLDCVYCECGATTKLTDERKEYVLCEKVVTELDHFFLNNPDPDYITFSGSGEPTLNSRLGDVLHYIKTKKPGIPVAVLTNATLLSKEDVREELLKADLVLPSLDAACQESFLKINKPHLSLHINSYIKGLVDFRKAYSGKIWLEVMILPGYNDSSSELKNFSDAFLIIQPDKIQINTLDRPGTLSELHPASRETLEDIKSYWEDTLKSKAVNIPVEIISSVQARKDLKSFRSDMETAILETIARRPCTVEDLAEILGSPMVEINKYLGVLEAESLIEHKSQKRGIFYQIKR